MLSLNKNYLVLTMLALLLVLMSACSGASSEGDHEHEHDGDSHSHSEEGHEGDSHSDGHGDEETDGHDAHDGEAPDRIDNNGASIRIISPEQGSKFQEGDSIKVEIEIEDFVLAESGAHWHVYVDDVSWGMVTGQDTDEIVRGLEPGEHKISAYLALGTHEELKDGAEITVFVE